MNWVRLNRKMLAVNNYVRKADAKTNYWFDLSHSKINYYRELTKDNFSIVIFGNENIETDFYTIPYKELKHLLVEDNFAKSERRKRWIGNIINHHIYLSNIGVKLNISHLYSNEASHNMASLVFDTERANDYAIENAKKEVQIRVKQSIFRQNVLENFGYKCCLTGTTESELLVASHIIPWSAKIETRLSPHNGLCLSVLYDRLFDKGFFTFSDMCKVIVTSRLADLSIQTQQWLNEILEKTITSPKRYKISDSALEYHRNNIFDKF